MSSSDVEDRLNRLEQKVRLLEDVSQTKENSVPWWERVAGAFKGDLVYAEAMKLAREERKADCVEGSGE